jgi:hypothetical protein
MGTVRCHKHGMYDVTKVANSNGYDVTEVANPNRYNVTNVASDSTGQGAAQSVTYFIPMNRLARRSS